LLIYRLDIADIYIEQKIKEELKGKNLACWCKPSEKCHANVLLEIANREDGDL
jgi:Domain of unknown function (DUF4326)